MRLPQGGFGEPLAQLYNISTRQRSEHPTPHRLHRVDATRHRRVLSCFSPFTIIPPMHCLDPKPFILRMSGKRQAYHARARTPSHRRYCNAVATAIPQKKHDALTSTLSRLPADYSQFRPSGTQFLSSLGIRMSTRVLLRCSWGAYDAGRGGWDSVTVAWCNCMMHFISFFIDNGFELVVSRHFGALSARERQFNLTALCTSLLIYRLAFALVSKPGRSFQRRTVSV